MSRRSARHAKVTFRYEGRHCRLRTSGPAALVGTAVKAVPASVVVGAASSALVLSASASAYAATTAPAGLAHGATDLTAVQTAALRTTVSKGRHAKPQSYTVVSGDTLSKISARFCGSAADFPSLAAASGISDPNVIYAGQSVKLRCHAAATTARPASGRDGDGDSDGDGSRTGATSSSSSGSGATPARQPHAVSSSGMSAFEACVISRESGGNPRAVNPYSGAGGLFQFLPSTWASLGYAAAYPGGAQTAPASVQKAAFAKLYAAAGSAPWAPYDGC